MEKTSESPLKRWLPVALAVPLLLVPVLGKAEVEDAQLMLGLASLALYHLLLYLPALAFGLPLERRLAISLGGPLAVLALLMLVPEDHGSFISIPASTLWYMPGYALTHLLGSAH